MSTSLAMVNSYFPLFNSKTENFYTAFESLSFQSKSYPLIHVNGISELRVQTSGKVHIFLLDKK